MYFYGFNLPQIILPLPYCAKRKLKQIILALPDYNKRKLEHLLQ